MSTCIVIIVSILGGPMSKFVVMLCDDQARFRDEFIRKHQAHYDIITVDDSAEVIDKIEQLKNLPDILLLDLYHPKDDNPDFEQRRLKAEEELTKLDQQIEIANQAVLDTWEPHGIDVLRALRQQYPMHKLPVAIYTQKGMILLNDDQLRAVEQFDGHWLLKKKLSARTEKTRIDRLITYDKGINNVTKSDTRLYRLALTLSWLIISLLAAKVIFDATGFQNVLLAIVGAFMTALITFLLAPFLEQSSKKEV